MNGPVPIMLYDGDCGFCRSWIKKWHKITAGQVRYEPYQKVINEYPLVTKEQCRKAVRLIMPDGSVFSGAHAVFKAFTVSGRLRLLLWCYEHLPLFGIICEQAYQIIARNRAVLAKL